MVTGADGTRDVLVRSRRGSSECGRGIGEDVYPPLVGRTRLLLFHPSPGVSPLVSRLPVIS